MERLWLFIPQRNGMEWNGTEQNGIKKKQLNKEYEFQMGKMPLADHGPMDWKWLL